MILYNITFTQLEDTLNPKRKVSALKHRVKAWRTLPPSLPRCLCTFPFQSGGLVAVKGRIVPFCAGLCEKNSTHGLEFFGKAVFHLQGMGYVWWDVFMYCWSVYFLNLLRPRRLQSPLSLAGLSACSCLLRFTLWQADTLKEFRKPPVSLENAQETHKKSKNTQAIKIYMCCMSYI